MSIAAINVENIAGDKDRQARFNAFRRDVAGAAGRKVAITLTESNPATDEVLLLVQVTDAAGEAVAAREVIRLWWAATEYAAPADLGTDNLMQGTVIEEVTTDAHWLLETTVNGEIEMEYVMASPGYIYAMVEIGGRVFTGGERTAS